MDNDDVNTAGGPAFPVSIPGTGDNGWHGMTLRDWFAGQALLMPALEDMRSDDELRILESWREVGGRIRDHLAVRAYEMADAMLAERSKKQEG